MKKIFNVFLFAMLASALAFAGIACMGEVQAQSASKKPGVPEFTVRYVDYFYDVAPKQSVNAYTGEVSMGAGYHAINRTVEITIKNQPDYPDLRYNVRYKGHYTSDETTWIEVFQPSYEGAPAQSDSTYTVISYSAYDSILYFYTGRGLIWLLVLVVVFLIVCLISKLKQ